MALQLSIPPIPSRSLPTITPGPPSPTPSASNRRGLRPTLLSHKIESLLGSPGVLRTQQLAALRRAPSAPVKLSRLCGRLMKCAMAMGSGSSDPDLQLDAFKHLISLTTRFPILRRLFLRSVSIAGVQVEERDIGALWPEQSRSQSSPNEVEAASIHSPTVHSHPAELEFGNSPSTDSPQSPAPQPPSPSLLTYNQNRPQREYADEWDFYRALAGTCLLESEVWGVVSASASGQDADVEFAQAEVLERLVSLLEAAQSPISRALDALPSFICTLAFAAHNQPVLCPTVAIPSLSSHSHSPTSPLSSSSSRHLPLLNRLSSALLVTLSAMDSPILDAQGEHNVGVGYDYAGLDTLVASVLMLLGGVTGQTETEDGVVVGMILGRRPWLRERLPRTGRIVVMRERVTSPEPEPEPEAEMRMSLVLRELINTSASSNSEDEVYGRTETTETETEAEKNVPSTATTTTTTRSGSVTPTPATPTPTSTPTRKIIPVAVLTFTPPPPPPPLPYPLTPVLFVPPPPPPPLVIPPTPPPTVVSIQNDEPKPGLPKPPPPPPLVIPTSLPPPLVSIRNDEPQAGPSKQPHPLVIPTSLPSPLVSIRNDKPKAGPSKPPLVIETSSSSSSPLISIPNDEPAPALSKSSSSSSSPSPLPPPSLQFPPPTLSIPVPGTLAPAQHPPTPIAANPTKWDIELNIWSRAHASRDSNNDVLADWQSGKGFLLDSAETLGLGDSQPYQEAEPEPEPEPVWNTLDLDLDLFPVVPTIVRDDDDSDFDMDALDSANPNPVCAHCGVDFFLENVNEPVVRFGAALFHPRCFKCGKCAALLSPSSVSVSAPEAEADPGLSSSSSSASATPPPATPPPYPDNDLSTTPTTQTDRLLLVLTDADGTTPICTRCAYRCTACSLPILEEALLAGGDAYHAECFRCRVCRRGLLRRAGDDGEGGEGEEEMMSFTKTRHGACCMRCYNDRAEKAKSRMQMKSRTKSREKIRRKRRSNRVSTGTGTGTGRSTPTPAPPKVQSGD
ncbi:hypothetical protein C8F01DRAFT_1344017 [Mycena amicta]|nr:hypothetical protein C8F01DRAFT_1344017 [Mycena amicta]